MSLAQGLGLVAVLLRSAVGRGATAIQGRNKLDWTRVPLPALAGGSLSPRLFQGQVVLLVNTASRCGFTPQYRGLQALWELHRRRGLVVLGVPSNDFAGQEPGSDAEIRAFCDSRFGLDFPLLARQRVTGPEAHPLYRWAAAEGGAAAVPRWNFHKLLIGRDGRLAGAFTAFVRPSSPRLARALEGALGN